VRELAQLLLPSARWDDTAGFAEARPAVLRAVKSGVGGFVVEGGTRDAIRALTAEIREHADTALILAVDPLALASTLWCEPPIPLLPAAAILSLRDPIAVRHVARAVAREVLRAGCNAVLAPSCDVPRLAQSDGFGQDATEVADACAEWIDAAQAEGVLCIAGSFPGAGASEQGTTGYPAVRATDEVLYTIDLVPFRAAIDSGVAALRLADATYAALDGSGAPASLSRPIATRLLRDQLGFDGLVAADASALARLSGARVSAPELVAAGVDLVMRPPNVDVELRALLDALEAGRLDRERAHESAQRRRVRAELAGRTDVPPNDPDWLAEAAERAIAVVRGRSVRLSAPVEVGAVSAPGDGARLVTAFAGGLGDAGKDASSVRHVAAPTDVVRTPLAVLLAARADGRGAPAVDRRDEAHAAGLCAEARRLGRDAVVIWCGHPATAPQITDANLVIACWSASAGMVRAAGRWLVRRT
jgi:beta-glucosidase-like glycosyl hydrolase